MSKLDKDQVIAAFTEAYTAVNGKAPAIEAKGGWYSVDGGKNMRLADLNTLAEELASSDSAPKAEAKVAAKEKPEVKKAPKAKAPAKKASSKKAKKSDFSVKAFWAEKITAENSGAKLPR